MKWNESEYGDVKDIRMPPSSLWKPDILMYNRYLVGWVSAQSGVKTFISAPVRPLMEHILPMLW